VVCLSLVTDSPSTTKLHPPTVQHHETLLSLALCHQLLDDAAATLNCVRALRQLDGPVSAGAATASSGAAVHPAVALLAFSAHLALGNAAAAQGEALDIVASEAADRRACLGAALELLQPQHAVVGADSLRPGKLAGACMFLTNLKR